MNGLFEKNIELKDKYSVSWNTPSRNSSQSMPLGGYSMGCNVWVEDNYLMIYLAQSGAFDENGTLLKLGRIRINAPEIDFSKDFMQVLYPVEGTIVIAADGVQFTLWCDVSQSKLNIQVQGKQIMPQIFYDCWRYVDHNISGEEKSQCRDWLVFGDAVTRKDEVEVRDGEIFFRHTNTSPNVFDLLIAQQKLEPFRELYRDVVTGRSFGGLLMAPGMKAVNRVSDSNEDAKAGDCEHDSKTEAGCLWEYAGIPCMSYELKAEGAESEWFVSVSVYSSQEKNWEEVLRQKASLSDGHKAVRAWWNRRYEESFIDINPNQKDSIGYQIARNYALFRFQQLCNAKGEFPTKFNGGLFTFDEGFTPDFRAWGGTTFTAQNQSLVYWPMLKNGDFDVMKAEFNFYQKITAAQKALTKAACGHGGAFFNEQITVFGMSSAAEYERPGEGRREEIPIWDLDSPWVRLHFSEGLEFALMILMYEKYSGNDISEYLEFIDSVVTFYFEHYPVAGGKLRVFPGTSLETFKGTDPHSADAEKYGVSNLADVIAGLRAVLELLIDRTEEKQLGEVAEGLINRDEERQSEEVADFKNSDGAHQKKYKEMLALCPDFPLGLAGGTDVKVWKPAEEYAESPFNSELPQLCRVFPYSPKGLSEEEIKLGIDTLHHSIQREDQALHVSWHQNGIFMARLGLVEEAKEFLIKKLGNSERRFPTFWGPGHDWTTDHNWGGSGAIQLQEMLVNVDGGKVNLFPCWPKDWDAHFKLYGPDGRLIEAEIWNGVIINI